MAEIQVSPTAAKRVFEGLDKLSNAIQGFAALEGMFKAQAGLVYNNHTFAIPSADQKSQTAKNDEASKSLATKSETSKSESLAAVRKVDPDAGFPIVPVVFPFLRIECRTLLRKGLIEPNIAAFGVVLRHDGDQTELRNGQVVLLDAKGFDSEVGSQLQVNFDGVEWPGTGYLVTLQGFVNEVGFGFENFAGGILITRAGQKIPQGFSVARSTFGGAAGFRALTSFWDSATKCYHFKPK